MDELPPDISKLVDAARHGHDPDEQDRRRVHRAVLATLAAGGPTAQAPQAADPAAGAQGAAAKAGASWATPAVKVTGTLLALAAAGGLWMARAPSSPGPSDAAAAPDAQEQPTVPTREAAAATDAAPTTATPSPGARQAAAPQPATAEPQTPRAQDTAEAPLDGRGQAPTTSSRRAPRPRKPRTQGHPAGPRPRRAGHTSPAELPTTTAAPQDTRTEHVDAAPTGIQAELVLIRRAGAELRDGLGAAALRTLQTHAQEHPQGALSVEREGLRAIALCATGQLAAGRAARASFLARYPQATMAARVRAACAESGAQP